MTDARVLTLSLGGKWHGCYGAAPCPVCQPERRQGQNALTLADGCGGRLLAHCKRTGCAFADIAAAAEPSSGGYAPPDPAEMARREAERLAEAQYKAQRARLLWREARSIEGTAAVRYLREARGIPLERLPAVLRFHPACWHVTGRRLPALVAVVEGVDGFSVHRTYLRADGSGKADATPTKAMLGGTAGGAVRLSDGPGPLLVGEGIESTLAAWMLHGEPTVTAWAALSTSGMRGLRLPRLGEFGRLGSGRASLIIAVDGEKAGRDAGRELGERASGLGWNVGIMDPGDGADWNDRLIGKEGRHECS